MEDRVYGRHAVKHLLEAGKRPCHQLFILESSRDSALEALAGEAEKRDIPTRRVSGPELTRRAEGSTSHQGVVALCTAYPYTTVQNLIDKDFLLILDEIQDPQNVGALIRTASCLGVGGMILPERRGVGMTATVCKAAAGAAEYLPIARVGNIAQTMKVLKDKEFWLYGAVLGAPQLVDQVDFTNRKVGLVLGGEGKGIRRLVGESCDVLFSIPQQGPISSLNVSVAGAICIFEARHQKKKNFTDESVDKG